MMTGKPPPGPESSTAMSLAATGNDQGIGKHTHHVTRDRAYFSHVTLTTTTLRSSSKMT
jgi:hypothetical protein